MDNSKRHRNLLINTIQKRINDSISVKQKLKNQSNEIIKATDLITQSIQKHGKIILIGNGGSAADAQHIAAEFIGKFLSKRQSLPAIALSTNSSSITAIGNDFGYEFIFSRQLEGIGQKNDVLIAISTSGNSKNVLLAIKQAKKLKIKTIGLTGKKKNKMEKIVDCSIKVHSENTQNIQESHILIGHILVELVETQFLKFLKK